MPSFIIFSLINLITIFILISSCTSFPVTVRESSCNFLRQGGCHCLRWEQERQCCCSGSSVEAIPQDLWRNVTKLIMKKVAITEIFSNDFQNYTGLTQIEIIQAQKLVTIDATAFVPLPRLKKLSITYCENLKNIQGYLMEKNNELLTLDIKRTALHRIPKMKMIKNSLSLPNIDFSENEIESIETGDAENIQVSLLRLSYNRIKYIGDYAFKNSKMSMLSLDNNPITVISPNAFSGVSVLIKLDLSHTQIQSLPEDGLRSVEILNVQETPTLKQLPPLFAFPNLKEAILEYPYHCCLFKHATASKDFKIKKYEGNIQELREKHCYTTTTVSTTQMTTTTGDGNCTDHLSCHQNSVSLKKGKDGLDPGGDYPKQIRKRHIVGQFGVFYDDEESEEGEAAQDVDAPVWGESINQDQSKPNDPQTDFSWGAWDDEDTSTTRKQPLIKLVPAAGTNRLIPRPEEIIVWESAAVSVPSVVVSCVDDDRAVEEAVQKHYDQVKCTPLPDDLNPCEDVMIGWHLRILIFFVWIAAIVGNLLVILVLFITKQPRQRVNNFLMLNLAIADLCTGIYLAMLALMDIKSKGEYYNYAVAWQYGWGCKIAGTLTIFASELSIVTMIMISFEVWYNTKYAIYQKRLTLTMAMPVMALGWIVACTMAALPLIGISDYSATSTCLPLRLENSSDQIYLTIGLSLNVLGFGYIVYNYLSVYRTVAGSKTHSTAHTQDMALAKLMFCLIFTDFLCWAPTVFFGLTAALDIPLIGISTAKIFLVLFYPLNAFANPWLYVFLTKRFRQNMSRFIRKHVWLREFLTNSSTRRRRNENLDEHDNYFYQPQPSHDQTQTTNLNSQRSSPSTCSSSLATPRGSKSSIQRSISSPSPSDSNSTPTPRNSNTGSCNEILFINECSNLLLTQTNPVVVTVNGNTTAANGVRRKSTQQKFRPQMSDIIENSNSNSTEDDTNQHHKNSIRLIDRLNSEQKKNSSNTNYLFYDLIPNPLSNFIRRANSNRKSDDDLNKKNHGEIELISYKSTIDDQSITRNRLVQRTDSASGLSEESGYATTTPLLLTPDSSDAKTFISDKR